ncbi:MAG: YfiR family protein [Fibrobacteres bacterium]|jgi:hypothetical protein|nr:YfiR family protein [Fibrobacterota bacterium]
MTLVVPALRFLPVRLLAILAPFWLAAPVHAQIAQEFAIKASFIAKFVAFVKWPAPREGASGADSGVFRVAVFGDNPFHEELETALRKSAPASVPVRVETVRDVRDLRGSKLVFIGAAEKGSVAKLSAWAEANGALTIGDGDGFAGQGVIINFYRDGSKVRFEINPAAAERSGFQISSLLLKVARIVEDR